MSKESLRTVKEVNGWRVNHPHSAANIFYALFTFFVLAVPVAYVFVPTAIMWQVDVTPNIESSFNGVDVVKFAISFIELALGKTYPIENELIKTLYDANFSGQLIYQAVPYL